MWDISAVLVSYNTIEMTKKALNCLFASSHNFKMNVIVIDNDSRDHSAEKLRHDYPHITLLANKQNVGFGRANNQALPFIDSRYLLLLNTDAFVEADTVAKTVRYMDDHPSCGILGVKLLARDGALQPSCRFFPTPWNIFLNRTGLHRLFRYAQLIDDKNWNPANIQDCDWVPGCYYLIRREVVNQIGLFDPRFFLYYEEVDHCYAAKAAGWHVTYYPHTSVIHIGGESAKSTGEITTSGRQIKAIQIESELLYFRKRHGLSGVLLHLLLNNIADLIQSAKDLFKFKSPVNIIFNLKHSLYIWKSFFKTRFATLATR